MSKTFQRRIEQRILDAFNQEIYIFGGCDEKATSTNISLIPRTSIENLLTVTRGSLPAVTRSRYHCLRLRVVEIDSKVSEIRHHHAVTEEQQ